MIKIVRVILSATVGPFVSGMREALGSFSGLVSGVTSGAAAIGMILTGIQSAVQLAVGAFRALGNAVSWVKQTFLDGAIASERNKIALISLVKDAGLADQIYADLRQNILKYGMDAREAEFATIQLSMALRGMYGEVDPQKLSELQDMMLQITTIRPDIIGGAQAVGRGLAAALGGDFTTLTRLLDLPLRQIQGLSAETQALLEGGEQATEQTLGTVTRLGEKTATVGGDYIKALREILDAAGITGDLVDQMTTTTSGQLAILGANWQTFTDQVGRIFLPHLNTALEKLLELVEANRPAIDALAQNLGELAGLAFDKLIDFLVNADWEAIKSFSAEQWVEFAKAIGDIDWEAVTEAINLIANLVTGKTQITIPGTDTPLGGALEKLFNPETGAIGAPGSDPASQAGANLNQAFQDFWSGDKGKGLADTLNKLAETIASGLHLNVTTTVDGDGNIKTIAEEVSSDTLSHLVDKVMGVN